MPLYTFSCGCGWAAESLKPRDMASVACPRCGSTAPRESVYAVGFTGFARAPVGERERSMSSFDEAAAEIEYQQTRQTNVDGSEKPAPNFWQAGKARAAALQSKGVTDSLDVR